MESEINPDKTYSTRSCKRPPGDTVERAWSKTSVIKVLEDRTDAIRACVSLSHHPSAKMGPQGQRKAENFKGSMDPHELAEKVDNWTNVRAYVTPIRDDGTQKVRVSLGTTSTFAFVVDANKVAWV